MSNKKILQGHNIALESLATIAAIPLEKAGLTAWAKYNYLPKINLTNPTFKATVTSTGITITESSFDLSLLTEDNYKEILAGFHYQGNSYMHFELNSSGTLYWYSTSSSISTVTGYSNGVITTTTIYNNLGEQDFIYNGEKVFRAESKTLVGYVVSDDENAYPDKAVHTDGYYYAKAIDGIDLSLVGFTKGEIIEVYCNSKTNFVIPHSIGVLPKLILLIVDGSISYSRVAILVATKYKNGSDYYYMDRFGTANNAITITDIFDTYYEQSNGNTTVTATDKNVSFNYNASNGGSYFSEGSKYKCLVLG